MVRLIVAGLIAVGSTYWIKMTGFTATQGYNQLESFINLSNTVFQVQAVETNWSRPSPPGLAETYDVLYADACGWDNVISSPNYLSCVVSDNKAGGNPVINTYQVKILSRSPGTTGAEPLTSMLYDFSGSSFHYNADFSSSARFVNVISPSLAKSFEPKVITPSGTSELIFTINNPSTQALTEVSFEDQFPTDMALGASPSITYGSGCQGSPLPQTANLTAGDTSISFTGIGVAASGTCTITLSSVTATTVKDYINTTTNLIVDEVDTGSRGTDTLTVVAATPVTPPTSCTNPTTIASWSFASGDSATSPPATFVASGVTASASNNLNGGASSVLVAGGSNYAWGINAAWPSLSGTAPGVTSTVPYYQFNVNAPNYGGVTINYRAAETPLTNWNSNSNYTWIYSSLDNSSYTLRSAANSSYLLSKSNSYTFYPNPSGYFTANSQSLGGGAYFRITFDGAAGVAQALIDEVIITGCAAPSPPTLAKVFNPTSIPTSPSTLTFTVTNPGAAVLTNVGFTDELPDGLIIANPSGLTGPNCSTGSMTNQSITANTGTALVSLSGATLAANASCTFSVNVTGTVSGIYHNVTSNISSDETGPNTTSNGYGQADLTVTAAPPVISKAFGTPTLLVNGSTTLTFGINNPNAAASLTGIGFTDTLPSGISVAAPAELDNQCGGSVTASGGTISLSGASLTALQSCTIKVNVTGITTGDDITNTVTVTSSAGTGNTATAVLGVRNPVPSVALLKKVSTSTTGPWVTSLTVNDGTPVYYQFTVENTGDQTLSSVTVTDSTLTQAGVNLADCVWSSIPVEGAGTCVTSAVNLDPGTNPNTATVTATYSSNQYTDTSTATVIVNAVTGISLAKTAPATVTAGGNLAYTLILTNNGTTPSGTTLIVKDLLPDGVVYVSAAGASNVSTVSCVGSGQLKTCTVSLTSPLAASGAGTVPSASFTITTMAGNMVGEITNYATANPAGTGDAPGTPGVNCEPNATTVCAEATTDVLARAEDENTVGPSGGTGVVNPLAVVYGPNNQPLQPADAVVTPPATLPAGFSYDPTNSNVNVAAGTIPGNYQMEFVVCVRGDLQPQMVIASTVIAGPLQPGQCALVTLDVVVTGSPIPPPNPIPSLGEWGRLWLVLMLLGIAWKGQWLVRRR